jgi:hypothetical protein
MLFSTSTTVVATLLEYQLDDHGVYAEARIGERTLSQTATAVSLPPGYYVLVIEEQPTGSTVCARIRRPFRVLDDGYAIHVAIYPKRVVGDYVLIPAGRYWIGSDAAPGALSPHWAEMHEDILIRPGLVTNGMYGRFLGTIPEDDRSACMPLGWKDAPLMEFFQPVTGVSWQNATRYCDFVGASAPLRRGTRLPKQKEWLVAAGTFRFGLGTRLDRKRFPTGTTLPQSGSFVPPHGIAMAPSGVHDLGFGIEIGEVFHGSPLPNDVRIPFFGRTPESAAVRSLRACTLGSPLTQFPRAVFRVVRPLDPNLRIVS